MFKNLDTPPHGNDVYTWADFIELRALVHPDKCYSRGEFASLLNRAHTLGRAVPDAGERWNDVKLFIRQREAVFGAAYPFKLSADEDTLELTEDALTAENQFYLTLLLCASMAYLDALGALARVFEECSLLIFTKLMPEGSEVHPAWAGPGAPARYQGLLTEKYRSIARDIRAVPTYKDRDFHDNDTGDGGIDIVAWHGMCDVRDAVPSALAQCGCSREDWRRKHLEASPAKLRSKLNPHHPWATYYFMPIDLRWADGDWAYKNDFGDAIMVDRSRLINLARSFALPPMPMGAHVADAMAVNFM